MTLESPITRERYPLRYWSLVAFATGVPNFIQFDSTGLTHQNGLFNLTTISSMILTALCAGTLILLTILRNRPIATQKVPLDAGIWLSLLVVLTVSTLLQPAVLSRHLTNLSSTDKLIGIYRLGEWSLAFLLILSAYTREARETATAMIIRVIGTMTWFKIVLVWLMLPIDRELVYGSTDDSGHAVARFGGAMVHPNHLAIMSGMAFFYALFFYRSYLRGAACALALLTLALTYARSEEGIFTLVLVGYMLTAQKPKVKLTGVLAVSGGVVGALFLQEKIMKYMARGNGSSNITTLSERTFVWEASFRAFWQRPILGYGFISGAKRALQEEWSYTYWIPPHSHNEFIEALLAGGVLACALVACLYLRVIWTAFRNARNGVLNLFLLLALLQVVLASIFSPVITFQFGDTGSLFLLCFAGIMGARTTEIQRVKASLRAGSKRRANSNAGGLLTPKRV